MSVSVCGDIGIRDSAGRYTARGNALSRSGGERSDLKGVLGIIIQLWRAGQKNISLAQAKMMGIMEHRLESRSFLMHYTAEIVSYR